MVKNGFSYGLIQKFAVLYLVVWTISPPLQIGTVYRLLALACAGVWFVIWFIRENPVVLGKDQVGAIFFLIFVLGVVFFEKSSFSNILKQIAMIMLVICFLMNHFYKDRWDELSGLIPVILILLIIWNGNTIKALIEDPTIARRLVRDDESIYSYMQQGIGGYSLVYPQVCICPVIFAWIIKAFNNSKLLFTVGAAWLVSYVWLLSIAGYSIAIFASVTGAILLLFYRGKSATAAFIVAATIFIGIMAAILYVDSFRNWLLEFFDGTAVAKKINDLVSTSETGETGESIQVRINAYSSSIMDIIKYPIIGSLWRESGGGHSALLDTLSKYGLLGLYMFAKIFYASPLYYKNSYNNGFIVTASNATMITMLFVSLLDSFNYTFTCMILLLAPLFFEDILKWTEVGEE